MSRNLTDILRARESESRPTALDVLKDAMDERGEISDDDRRRAAAVSGLPEATVYGISTFYDDLVQPRGERHVRVCTGTACWASDFGEHVAAVEQGLGLGLGERAEDGSVSLGETVCLGFCHTAAAVREGDVVDAGPDVVDRLLGGGVRQAEEPVSGSVLDEPVLLRRGSFEGLRHARGSLSPEQLLEQVKEANVRGRGGAGFPAGTKWEFAARAADPDRAIVVNGDEGDPGSYIDQLLMERNPELLIEGMALAGYAVGARHGYVLVRSEYPLSMPALREAVERSRGELQDFEIEIVEGAG